MTARRKVAMVAALGIAPIALTALAAAPAVGHGSMKDPVSRIAACFAEGPENPDTDACKALVAAGGTQPLYDWNEVNIGDVAGAHKTRIPDGKLCSVGRDKYKGLDAPRADWPSTAMTSGNNTFRWRATAPHRGTLELYITKDSYNPTQPLKWSDLEAQPFASVTNPPLENGSYVFNGTVPNKSGRHLVYSILQRSDSPEAFYTCSDVVFGGGGGNASNPEPAKAPSDAAIEQGAAKSDVDHNGKGGDTPTEVKKNAAYTGSDSGSQPAAEAPAAKEEAPVNAPEVQGATENLAETGGDSNTTYVAIGGAAALALGAAAMFGTTRRRAARNGR
ncbi:MULTISPECIES: lytic polysaccharide monooxygenase auxiliary activity family 9 protein [unclassified Streptomyces]|uniref:lytic polysaccharide monooxygenase auxiliary activity family 9 protein n=1 Tax=unclassified Streptomyces TaxID=2593676 RepID=UPI002E2D36E9|nr:lytic polysaccharide monooxygenase [Streptomyces sp. NBC_00690]